MISDRLVLIWGTNSCLRQKEDFGGRFGYSGLLTAEKSTSKEVMVDEKEPFFNDAKSSYSEGFCLGFKSNLKGTSVYRLATGRMNLAKADCIRSNKHAMYTREGHQ